MAIASFPFAALVSIGALLFHISPSPTWRHGVLLGLSAAFLLSFGLSVTALWPIFLFGAVTMLAIMLSARDPGPRCPLAIAILLAVFLFLKGYLPISLAPSALMTVGISYVLFRAVQVLSDLRDEAIHPTEIDPLELLLFLFSFLTLLAGPIQRFQDFRTQLAETGRFRVSDVDFQNIISRATIGLCKLVIIAPGIQQIYQATIGIDGPALRIGLGASIFMVWIYLNFSAYMDIVIAVGNLFGFRLPENFNRPDRSINFLDVWNRWHITLSRTFLTYVFNPLVRAILQILPEHPMLAGVSAYLCVFFLIGWWHGPESQFALSGLMFGVAAGITKAWQIARQRRLLPDWRLPGGTIISGGLGLGACAVALIPTWPLFTSTADVVAAMGSPFRFVQVLGVAWLAGMAVRLAGLAFDHVTSNASIRVALAGCVRHPITIGTILVVIFAVQLSANDKFSPIVYYQRF